MLEKQLDISNWERRSGDWKKIKVRVLCACARVCVYIYIRDGGVSFCQVTDYHWKL